MTASFNGHVAIVRLLIEAKAQVNMQTEKVLLAYNYNMTHRQLRHPTGVFCPQYGFTALYMAAQEGKVEVVRLLMEAKALMNIPAQVHTSLSHTSLPHITERGATIYYWYIHKYQSELLQIQLDIRIRSSGGSRILEKVVPRPTILRPRLFSAHTGNACSSQIASYKNNLSYYHSLEPSTSSSSASLFGSIMDAHSAQHAARYQNVYNNR